MSLVRVCSSTAMMSLLLLVLSDSASARLLAADPPKAEAAGVGDWDALLKKYVKGDYFDYAGLHKNKADLARLDGFLKWQADAKLTNLPVPDQIAFYINAYNACCVKAILDHYPVHSPKDVKGFFDGLKFQVAGESLTISQIEYDRLIARYKDMRAHFAVVCADRGCLPLRPAAYTGADLDKALETAAQKFVGDPRQFKVDPVKGEIEISKIFEWYGEKFTADPKRPASRAELFLAPWVDDKTKKLLESGKYKLRIIEWDWTLNEKLGP